MVLTGQGSARTAINESWYRWRSWIGCSSPWACSSSSSNAASVLFTMVLPRRPRGIERTSLLVEPPESTNTGSAPSPVSPRPTRPRAGDTRAHRAPRPPGAAPLLGGLLHHRLRADPPADDARPVRRPAPSDDRALHGRRRPRGRPRERGGGHLRRRHLGGGRGTPDCVPAGPLRLLQPEGGPGGDAREPCRGTGVGSRAPGTPPLVGITDTLPDFYAQWEEWSAGVTESHTTYPVLLLFRSPEPWFSWLVGLLAVLDGAAMHLTLSPTTASSQARLCLRMGFTALNRVATTIGWEVDLDPDPEGPIQLTYEEFADAVRMLQEVGFDTERTAEEAWPDFRGWRVNYETVSYRLADRLTTPPGALVGTPQPPRRGLRRTTAPAAAPAGLVVRLSPTRRGQRPGAQEARAPESTVGLHVGSARSRQVGARRHCARPRKFSRHTWAAVTGRTISHDQPATARGAPGLPPTARCPSWRRRTRPPARPSRRARPESRRRTPTPCRLR